MAKERVWFASPNGDWWGGKDTDFVFVLREDDIPKDEIENIEQDKFEKLIIKYGKVSYIDTHELV